MIRTGYHELGTTLPAPATDVVARTLPRGRQAIEQQGAAGAVAERPLVSTPSIRDGIRRAGAFPWRPLAFLVAWFLGWVERHVIATAHEGDDGWAEMDETPRPIRFGTPRVCWFDGEYCRDCLLPVTRCRCGGGES